MGNCLTLIRCAQRCLDTLAVLAEDTNTEKNDLMQCGPDILARFRSSLRCDDYQKQGDELAKLVALAYARMTSVHHSQVRYCWRRLYTDATLALVCAAVYHAAQLREECTNGQVPEPDWGNWVRGLDMVIIIASAPGEGRLEIVHDLIYGIQSAYDVGLSAPPVAPSPVREDVLPAPAHAIPVPRLSKAPSMAAFERMSSTPFILPAWARDWPAMKEKHDWSRASYLLSVAGPGRVVPVEVGADYRNDDWTQELMEWEEFLKRIGMLEGGSDDPRPVYLAQYNMFRQFHKLRDDIQIPDYVYANVGEAVPEYRPPSNEEGYLLNNWLGPKGMTSPAHTDPYYNFYTQVVGRKTIWLAPPTLRREMYPFRLVLSSNLPSKPPSSTSLNNTTSIDIFSPPPADKPLFRDKVLPHAMCCVLEPGDMLFIPLGWWHATRAEDISLSVSMWF